MQARTKWVFKFQEKLSKNWKIQFSCECCSFSQSNDKASGEGCAPFVCRLAQSRFSFPMQELGKVGKSCFPMSVVHLYCPMARPVGRVLLWTPPEVSVSFHRFSIYIFIAFPYIFIYFLNIFIDFLNSSILFLTPPQGPSKFPQKSGATSLVKSLLKKWSIVAENLFSCPTPQNALLEPMPKSCFFGGFWKLGPCN